MYRDISLVDYIRQKRYPYKKRLDPTISLDHLHLLPLATTCKPSNSEQYILQKLIGCSVLCLAAARTYIIRCVPSCPAWTIEMRSTSPSSQKHYVVCPVVHRQYQTPIVGHKITRPRHEKSHWRNDKKRPQQVYTCNITTPSNYKREW